MFQFAAINDKFLMFIPLLLLFMGAYFLVASYQRKDKHEQGRAVAALIKELSYALKGIALIESKSRKAFGMLKKFNNKLQLKLLKGTCEQVCVTVPCCACVQDSTFKR
ncbi:hypothetical protein BCV71DRAFT_236146 [Rhizopus microsporus]|uniref:Uncharacterized protein n=1 Tax=Rhizopus microsporus TaxID=58291 RepID=A0A1X0RYH9_RHIZD|nr:hypothetical protein BCV71DRAFT_236146 [Rhizopus microsporus]